METRKYIHCSWNTRGCVTGSFRKINIIGGAPFYSPALGSNWRFSKSYTGKKMAELSYVNSTDGIEIKFSHRNNSTCGAYLFKQ
jgi:hypothetical protein